MSKMVIIILLILLIFIVIFTAIHYQNKKTKKEFDLFYSTQLSGKIAKIDIYSRGANFVLDNNPIAFTFYPYVDKNLNNGEIFQYIAKPGDHIYKPAYSDTLFLIKNDKIYSYTFQKK